MAPLADRARSAADGFRRRPLGHRIAIVGLVVLAVVAVVFVVAVATTHIAFDSSSTDSKIPEQSVPSLKERLRIAFRFAPVLRLAKGELFVPIDRDAYLADTELEERKGKLASLLSATTSVNTLPTSEGDCKLSDHCFYFLNIKGLEPPASKPAAYHALQEEAFAHGATRRVYFNVTRYHDTGDYAVQYWFLYFLNYRFNTHESDWEQITVHLDPDQEPVEAWYSSHATGFKRPWSKVEVLDGHPVVYAALGSHANYFTRRPHAVTLHCATILKRNVCVGNRVISDRSDGKGRELRLGRDYKLRELIGPVYVGSYGSGNYVAGQRRDEILADPRTRISWLNALVRFVLAKRAQ
jgi:hypothetical protein